VAFVVEQSAAHWEAIRDVEKLQKASKFVSREQHLLEKSEYICGDKDDNQSSKDRTKENTHKDLQVEKSGNQKEAGQTNSRLVLYATSNLSHATSVLSRTLHPFYALHPFLYVSCVLHVFYLTLHYLHAKRFVFNLQGLYLINRLLPVRCVHCSHAVLQMIPPMSIRRSIPQIRG
jgi:hypothetical protein